MSGTNDNYEQGISKNRFMKFPLPLEPLVWETKKGWVYAFNDIEENNQHSEHFPDYKSAFEEYRKLPLHPNSPEGFGYAYFRDTIHAEKMKEKDIEIERGKDRFNKAVRNYEDALKEKDEEIERLRDALTNFMAHYKRLVDSGDYGFWDVKTEDVYIKATEALTNKDKA